MDRRSVYGSQEEESWWRESQKKERKGGKEESRGRGNVERKDLEEGERARHTTARKEAGWTGVQGPRGRAGGRASRPLPAATDM